MKSLKTVMKQFINEVTNSQEIELYNEAGFQHELGFFLREKLGDKFIIKLEKNIKDETVLGKELPKSDQFVKKVMDIYLFDRKTGKEKYCIELKFTYGTSIPHRMFNTYLDVVFLERLKVNAGFKNCYLLFVSLSDSYWNVGKTVTTLHKMFHGDKVSFKNLKQAALGNYNIEKFNKAYEKPNNLSLKLEKSYQAEWKDLKKQNHKGIERQWRYFLLEI